MQHAGATTVPLPFEDVAQQREAASLGMWIFLGTEVLFFGGLIVCYIVYRFEYPAAFHVSSARLSIPVGAVMTVVLLLGSLLVALSDQLIHQEPVPRRTIVLQLGLTALLGVTFLGMEAWEYVELINHGLLSPRLHSTGDLPNCFSFSSSVRPASTAST